MKTIGSFLLLCSTSVLLSQNLVFSSPVRFLALGDSYTIGESVSSAQRWPQQLMDSLQLRGFTSGTLEVIATTGWRTDNLLSAISGQGLNKKGFNLVSLLIGVNNQFQGKSISQYKKEFVLLLDSAIKFAGGNRSHVFIVSIPDYAYTPYGQQSSDPSKISSEIDTYNQLNKYYADSAKIRYFNITDISREGVTKPQYVASDGLHPSAVQYTQWVSLIMNDVRKLLSGAGESKKKESEIIVYPQPFSEKLKLEIQSAGVTEFSIYDLHGRLIQTVSVSAGLNEVDLSDLAKGVYTLRTVMGMTPYTFRIVKM